MSFKPINFNVAVINTCTELEGPYKRMAIWFQGCHFNCKGCCNPEFQTFKAVHLMSLEKLVEIAKKAKEEHGIEGVTYLGGEPTLQKHLDLLSKALHQINLGVILFTGFQLKQLDQNIVSSTDLIIDGLFIEKELDLDRNLVGSKNQTFNHISHRYEKDMDWFMNKRDLQVDINVSGKAIITGDVVIK